MHRKTLTNIAVLLALSAIAGAAWAVDGGGGPAEQEATPRHAVRSADDLLVFRGEFRPTAPQVKARGRLARMFARAPEGSLVSTADFERARPVAVPGSSDEAWVAPASNGGLCAFTPTGGEVYSSSCSTLEQFNATGLISVAMGPAGPAIVTVVQPDSVGNPVITAPDGAERELPLQSNVAVGPARAGDRLTAGGLTIEIRGREQLGAMSR